jgi:hypothetical protein
MLAGPGDLISTAKQGTRPVNTGKPYEDITRKIISENREFFGLNRVEPGPTSVPAIHGGKYKIEVLAYRKGDERLILFECRDREDRLDQEETGGFAYRIQVTGAAKGYLVTPVGLQSGARIVADYEKIGQITIPRGATAGNYLARFLDQILLKSTENLGLGDSVQVKVVGPDAGDSGSGSIL